uniref:hypothetical protein n=1 Tax=Trichocoleus desertorum TaxID=1481672 RepID=UPI0025B614D8|nr:hypothetical protein [Trichocoleus desertorum]
MGLFLGCAWRSLNLNVLIVELPFRGAIALLNRYLLNRRGAIAIRLDLFRLELFVYLVSASLR